MAVHNIVDFLRAAAWITTPISLLAFFGALLAWLAFKDPEQSLRRQLTGDGLQRDEILRILREFKDDDARLKALSRLLNFDRDTSRKVLDKVKAGVDVSAHRRRIASVWTNRLLITGGLLLGLSSILAFLPSSPPVANKPHVDPGPKLDTGAKTYAATAKPSSPQLSAVQQNRLAEALRKLADATGTRCNGSGPWTMGQQVRALNQLSWISIPFDANAILKEVDTDCWCFRKAGLKVSVGGHEPATFWALLGLAALHQRPPPNLTNSMLARQFPSGAWGILPRRRKGAGLAPADERTAATYATSLALLALVELTKNSYIEAAQSDRSQRALQNAVKWLTLKRQGNRARWKDFPSDPNGIESLAISGLALHALFAAKSLSSPALEGTLTPEVMNAMANEWVSSLPESLPPLDDTEKKLEVFLDNADVSLMNDAFQTSTPWLLIATTDAYRQVNAESAAKIERWLDPAIARLPLDEDAFYGLDCWHAAEAVIAIRYLRGEFVF